MLQVPKQLRANLNAWKKNPNEANHYPGHVLPPFGPPTHSLSQIESAKAQDNDPKFDTDMREGIIVSPATGDTVTLSKFGSKNYYEKVEADGDVSAMLYDDAGVHRVSYYTPGDSDVYSAGQSFVPMSGEGWHGSRDVDARR